MARQLTASDANRRWMWLDSDPASPTSLISRSRCSTPTCRDQSLGRKTTEDAWTVNERAHMRGWQHKQFHINGGNSRFEIQSSCRYLLSLLCPDFARNVFKCFWSRRSILKREINTMYSFEKNTSWTSSTETYACVGSPCSWSCASTTTRIWCNCLVCKNVKQKSHRVRNESPNDFINVNIVRRQLGPAVVPSNNFFPRWNAMSNNIQGQKKKSQVGAGLHQAKYI